ncbi:MAG: PD40 domain-containing protein [Candidatus Promineifilaceae bacterium]
MSAKVKFWHGMGVRLGLMLIFVVVLTAFYVVQTQAKATVVSSQIVDIERISVGTNGVQADGSSFFAFTSVDNRYITFHSWASNISTDQTGENWLDVFLRDRQTNTTIKITNGIDGPTNEDSFDAVLTADGRYVVYTSYAWNLVPNDTNRDAWSRNGLDIFLYDTQTQQTQRVSLAHDGKEIQGNSSGIISRDGTWILMDSDGPGILPSSTPAGSNLYLRNWRTGEIKLLVAGGENGYFTSWWPDYDASHAAFSSTFDHLAANDTNGEQDVFWVDASTGVITLVSRSINGGSANGKSGQSVISQDGRYVVFVSYASDLIPNDTNGVGDVFIYDRITDSIERVSVSSSGEQANGLSRDPSICGNGRYVSFSSDATNLVANDTNGKRDVFVHDMQSGETFVASVNSSGEQTNGKVHRSYLTFDCRYITYASDGTNIVPNDTNNARDLFMGRIYRQPDFSGSSAVLTPAQPGGTTTFRSTIVNNGTDSATADLWVPIPANTSLIVSSLPLGAVYNASQNRVEWQGSVAGESEFVFTFDLVVDSGLVDFTLLTTDATLTGDGQTRTLHGVTAVNGIPVFLPVIANE